MSLIKRKCVGFCFLSSFSFSFSSSSHCFGFFLIIILNLFCGFSFKGFFLIIVILTFCFSRGGVSRGGGVTSARLVGGCGRPGPYRNGSVTTPQTPHHCVTTEPSNAPQHCSHGARGHQSDSQRCDRTVFHMVDKLDVPF